MVEIVILCLGILAGYEFGKMDGQKQMRDRIEKYWEKKGGK